MNTARTNQTKTRGAVLYTRVSTGEQAREGTSLESQQDACRAKALALGLTIIAEYEDAGISGGLLLMREGMQSAIADIEAGRADTLVCANLSRYSRDVEHQQSIKKQVRAAGGHLIFCDMTFDDTPEGDLAFGIMGTFAQYEKQVIRARMMRGKKMRAQEGQQPQRSRPPYGYHIVTNAEVAAGLHPAEMRGQYLINESTAKVARRIFADYHSSAFSLSSLCRALNAEGIPPPSGGRSWMQSTVRVILMNPVYKGEPVSGRQRCSSDESRIGQKHKLTGAPIITPNFRKMVPEEERLTLSAPALVEAAVWEAVQARLVRGRTENIGNPRQTRLLSGQTVCPHCGGKTGIKQQRANGRRYHYFICNAFKKARYDGREEACRGDLYPVEIIEDAALQAVRDAWQQPQVILAALSVPALADPSSMGSDGNGSSANGSRVGENVPGSSPELQSAQSALHELKEEEMAIAQAQIAGIRSGASADLYAPMFADIAARRKELEARITALQPKASTKPGAGPKRRRQPEVRICDMEAAQRALETTWRVLTSPDVTGAVKRDLLMEIIEKVICHKDGAEVVFLPGVFGETVAEVTDLEAGEGANPIVQTTCMVCQVRAGQYRLVADKPVL